MTQQNNMPANQQKRQEHPAIISINQEAFKKQLALGAPKHVDINRLVRIITTMIRTNQNLANCTPDSIMSAAIGCATIGLDPEPALGQIYVIPFRGQATLMPSYKGMLELVRRSGEIKSISAQVVYENDFFELQYGIDEKLNHRPADGDRGEIKGVYAIFKYINGGYAFDYMTKADVDKIRTRSQSPNKGPWATDYAEMAKKTVIKRLVKTSPVSTELATAASVEDMAMGGQVYDFKNHNTVNVSPSPDQIPQHTPLAERANGAAPPTEIAIPDEIRKKAAKMLELPEYPEEPEEVRALTAKCRELMQAEVKF